MSKKNFNFLYLEYSTIIVIPFANLLFCVLVVQKGDISYYPICVINWISSEHLLIYVYCTLNTYFRNKLF